MDSFVCVQAGMSQFCRLGCATVFLAGMGMYDLVDSIQGTISSIETIYIENSNHRSSLLCTRGPHTHTKD